jgi:hypothetical protein
VSAARTLREVRQARAALGRGLLATSLALTVEMDDSRDRRRGLEVRFETPCERPAALVRRVRRRLAETAAGLPEALRHQLVVEAGEVRSGLVRDGSERPLLARRYEMACCRDVVLGIRELAQDGGGFASPWTGMLLHDELDTDLPVVLGPSAVLALVSYALEVAGGHVEAGGAARPPRLTIVDTAASPYPPQHHPFAGDGLPALDQPLIADGRWQDRAARAGAAVDPLFFLLTRPERALRPLAASVHFNRRNLAVAGGRAVAEPTPAVRVESWRVRLGPRTGVVPFAAELSQTGRDGARLAVAAPVALELDPWQLLASVSGACGPPSPALDADPIDGDSYGTAPALATGVTLAELLPRPDAAGGGRRR